MADSGEGGTSADGGDGGTGDVGGNGGTSGIGGSGGTSDVGGDGGVGVDGGDAGGPDSGGLPLGDGCTADRECESGFCTDGVCCAERCDTLCGRCDVADTLGSCSAADQDSACPEPMCPEDSECRRYVGMSVAQSCESLGVCRTEADCSVAEVDLGTACSGGMGACDGQGECIVPGKKALGDTCTEDDECSSAQCAATAEGGSNRVCCETACDGTCQACNEAGRCTDSLADDAGCGTIQCPADSACRDYPASVNQGRCVSGRCGTPEQVCPFNARGEGTSCASSLLCDASGGCSVAKRALGVSCTSNAQCSNNLCVDGVCCESACSGPCMACRAGTGRCDVLPADDTACSNVSCAFNADCVTGTVPGNITTNRCRALGQCKTTSDCGATFRPKGTNCGVAPRICDGAGACVLPSVGCGSAQCAMGALCCYHLGNDGNPATTCAASGECTGTPGDNPNPRTPAACDEHSDCRTGELCCYASASGGSDISCRAAADCNRSGAQVSFYEVCQSPAFTRPCSTGTCTIEIPSRFPGWSFCRF